MILFCGGFGNLAVREITARGSLRWCITSRIFCRFGRAHYRAQVGTAHCYVIDHGSDDGAVTASGLVNVVRLPRSPLDENWRAGTLSRICVTICSDGIRQSRMSMSTSCWVADPRRFDGLQGLCEAEAFDVLTAFGANVLEMDGEAPIDLGRRVTAQRRWMRPFSSLCKPVLTRRPITWSPGVHSADTPSVFGGLYLFHIAYADHRLTARRQAKRRFVPRSEGHGAHHDTAPEEMVRLMTACAALPRDGGAQLGGAAEAAFIADMLRDGRDAYGGRMVAADREPPVLWPLPRWLDGTF